MEIYIDTRIHTRDWKIDLFITRELCHERILYGNTIISPKVHLMMFLQHLRYNETFESKHFSLT